MKIAILASAGSPWVVEVVGCFVAAGFEVHLLHVFMEEQHTYSDPSDTRIQAQFEHLYGLVARVTRLNLPGFGMRKYLLLGKLIRKTLMGGDQECLLTLYAGGFGLSAMLSGVRPYAVYALGGDVLDVSGYRQHLTRLVFERAILVPANGEFIASEARRLAPRARIVPLLHGIDPGHFVPGIPDSDCVRVICSRGFQAVYNNATIIRALAAMPDLAVPWRFVFAAGGPLMEDCRALAIELMREDQLRRIEWCGGLSQKQLLGEFQRSHIYVSMSRYDSTSMALLESMACGCYPIVSDIKPNQPWVGEHGRRVGVEDHEALAREVAAAILDPARRDAARGPNRDLVLSRADGRETLKTLIPLLRQAIASHG